MSTGQQLRGQPHWVTILRDANYWDLKETGLECLDWTVLAQGRDK